MSTGYTYLGIGGDSVAGLHNVLQKVDTTL